MAVQRELNKILGFTKAENIYVKALCPRASHAASRFEFRLQNPDRWSEVLTRLNQLEKWKPFVLEPRVTGIEIALDAFNRHEYDHSALVSLAAKYCVHLTRPASDNRRFNGYNGQKGSARARTARTKYTNY